MTTRETSLHALPFSDDFIDVAALNERVSARLVERVESVRAAAQNGEKVASKAFAVLGAAGGGKTHLFARLRHRPDANATPILLRPYFGVSVSMRDVLAGVVDQLCLPVKGGDSTHLDLFSEYWLKEDQGGSLEGAVKKLVSLIPEIAPAAHLARAVLALHSLERSSAWAELAWLSGREPRPSIDEASASPLSEGDVLHMLRVLAVLAAPIAPLLITFDQLENLAGGDDTRLLGYANLVSEMVDTLPDLTIVQLALTSEWMQFIEPRLSLPQKTRLASQTLHIEAPTKEERELLLRAWHDRVGPTIGGRKKRFPYPLEADDVEHLLTAAGMTPRLLLAALMRAVSGEKPIGAPEEAVVESASSEAADDCSAAWNGVAAGVQREIDDKVRSTLPFDGAELAEGITSALSFVSNVEVTSRTERDRVQTWVRSPGHELTVIYFNSMHHISAASLLAKATELARSVKVVIVREQRFELPHSWETVHERRAAFEQCPNARWLWLSQNDTVDLLTLARLLGQSRTKKLRRASSDQHYALQELRDDLTQIKSPGEWQTTSSIARWLSDVPRADSQSVPPKPLGRRTTTSKAPPAQVDPSSEPSLRAWLSQGRDIGRAMASRYLERIKTLRRR